MKKMKHIIEGSFEAREFRFAIITARFNEIITSKLLSGAQDCLYRHGVPKERICNVWVPGAFEISLIAHKLAQSHMYNAIICLGSVIRGETPHFDYVCNEVAKGIASVSLKFEVPVIFGVLTTNTFEQAVMRAGAKGDNKGWQAALTALEMCNIMQEIDMDNVCLPQHAQHSTVYEKQ